MTGREDRVNNVAMVMKMCEKREKKKNRLGFGELLLKYDGKTAGVETRSLDANRANTDQGSSD